MEAEIIEKLPFADYLQIPALSQSTLKHIERSPGHLQAYLERGLKRTPEMIFGSAVDCLVFDGPQVFHDRYAVRPPGMDLRTKAGKAWKADHGHKETIPDTVLSCAGAVVGYPPAAQLLEAARFQLSLVWRDEETGVWLKGRPDAYVVGGHIGEGSDPPVAIDLKTTDDASPEAFAKKAYNLRYHWQAAMYLDGLEAIAGEPHCEFMFIVAEREPPHRVEVYWLPASIIEQGREEYRAALEKYAYWDNRGEWPLNSGQVLPLSFPGWAFK